MSKPSIEILWALADFFECSIDELVGRTLTPMERLGDYNEKKFRLSVIGEDLQKCSEISRMEGLLAMESYIPKLKGGSKFLAFAIPYILNLYYETNGIRSGIPASRKLRFHFAGCRAAGR